MGNRQRPPPTLHTGALPSTASLPTVTGPIAQMGKKHTRAGLRGPKPPKAESLGTASVLWFPGVGRSDPKPRGPHHIPSPPKLPPEFSGVLGTGGLKYICDLASCLHPGLIQALGFAG